MQAGYLQLQPASPQTVLAAQENLLGRRRELFGRLLALRLLGIPAPQFSGFSLFRSWIRLSVGRQFKTIAGTVRRAVIRGWWKRGHQEQNQIVIPGS
jgi:coenzyme F420 hydrogenase subunit beta